MKPGKKNNVMLKIASLLFLLSFMLSSYTPQQNKPWHAPESAKSTKNPVAVSPESIAAGKTLYTTHCKSCHGVKGKGDGPKASSLDVDCGDFTTVDFKNETDGEIYWKSTEGRDPMPSFKTKLTEDQRWQLINYIRTFGEAKK